MCSPSSCAGPALPDTAWLQEIRPGSLTAQCLRMADMACITGRQPRRLLDSGPVDPAQVFPRGVTLRCSCEYHSQLQQSVRRFGNGT